MMKLLIFAAIVLPYFQTAHGCWETGCNLNSWSEVGCEPLGYVEKSKRGCPGGFIYECCEKGEIGTEYIPGNSGGYDNAGSNGGSGTGVVDSGEVGQITFEQFVKAVTANYPNDSPGRDKYNAFIESAPAVGKISTKTEAAMALAQLLWESDGLKAKREYACQSTNCPESYRVPGCDYKGQYYFGRGYIQLSWCYNYKAASNDIYGDDRLVRNPDMVAQDEEAAWSTAFWFWKTNVHNKPGVQEGSFGATTNAINGGLECNGANRDKAVNRYKIYGRIRAAFGLSGPGIETGCYN